MKIEVRTFNAGDYATAFRLWESSEGVGLSEADSPEGITKYLNRNPGLSFVAFDGEQLVGTILCGHDGRRGLIHHLVVRASHRRSGLGRLLVQRGLTALHAQGINKCHLLVFHENTQAREFWLRVGGDERTSLVTFSLPTREDRS